MKTMIRLLAVAAMLLGTTCMTAQNVNKNVVLNGTNVRLRFEPNLQCKWLCDAKGAPTYLKKGTKLTYKGESGDFYCVEYKQQTLYVSKQYAYIEGMQAPASGPGRGTANTTSGPGRGSANAASGPGRGSAHAASGPGRGSAGRSMVVLNGTSVRLRLGPGTSYDYLKRKDGNPRYLNKGARLTYQGEEGDFYKCTFEGRTVYVSKQYSILQ